MATPDPTPSAQTMETELPPPDKTDAADMVRSPGSSLVISKEALKKLVEHVCDLVVNTDRANEAWYQERDNWIREHQNEFEHREKPGSIFENSNVSFNQSKRNAVPIISRLTRDFLGTEPFFSCQPVRKEGDTTEPDDIQAYGQFKMKKANLAGALLDAIIMSVVVNERVTKITHRRDVSKYKENATVMVGPDGQPVRTSDGETIYDTDQWVVDQRLSDPDLTTLQKLLAKFMPKMPTLFQWILQTIAPGAVPMVLQKDPSIPQPQGFGEQMFKTMLVDQTYVRYNGPDIRGIHHRDFVCPTWAEDIQTAPFCAHKFDMTVPQMNQQWVAPVDETTLDPQEKAFFADLLQNLQLFQGDTSEPKSAQGKAEHARKEVAGVGSDEFNPMGLLAEAYLSIDVDGDGVAEEIMITVALEKRFAFSIDYLPNVVPPKIGRPFRKSIVDPVPNRWYGMGEYANNAHKQEVTDWCANRLIYENLISGMIRGYNPKACIGWDTEPPKAGADLYEIRDPETFDPAKAVFSIPIPPLSDTTMKFMESFMQSSQAERGNLNPGGDTLSQLPSSRLKYGIQAIEQSGDEIYSFSVINIRPSLVAIVEAALITMLAHMDEEEEYQVTQGDTTLTRTMTKEALADVEFNVNFEMTLTRGDQVNEQNAAAIEMVLSYAALPAYQQAIVRPLFLNRLKTLDIQNPEDRLPAPDPQMVVQSQQAAMQAQMPPPPAPPSVPAKNSLVKPEPGAPPDQPKTI